MGVSENGILRFLIYKFPALAYMVAIFYSSSGPVTSPTLNAIPDYYLHTAGYTLLCVLVFLALHEGLDSKKGPGGHSVPMLVTVLYGISDEFHQSFVPGRNSEVKDVMADAVGAAVGLLVVLVLHRLISSFRRARTA